MHTHILQTNHSYFILEMHSSGDAISGEGVTQVCCSREGVYHLCLQFPQPLPVLGHLTAQGAEAGALLGKEQQQCLVQQQLLGQWDGSPQLDEGHLAEEGGREEGGGCGGGQVEMKVRMHVESVSTELYHSSSTYTHNVIMYSMGHTSIKVQAQQQNIICPHLNNEVAKVLAD